jgi:phosphoribosylformimino-5-aminoimidazole carboxamide ribotide isomerase
MQILPAIDIINGCCVRLTKGDYDSKKVYHTDPLEIAQDFEEAGSKFIHIVDLDAAKQQGDNWDTIYKIHKSTNLIIQMGGGIRNEEILKKSFDHGVQRCIIGSLAVKDINEVSNWISKYGAERIVIGADIRDGYIATHGWYETTDLKIDDFIRDYLQRGATTFLCTEISKDGMLGGIAVDLYKHIKQNFPKAQMIASGGVASMADIEKAQQLDMYGIVIGKAIYEGKISLDTLFKN